MRVFPISTGLCTKFVSKCLNIDHIIALWKKKSVESAMTLSQIYEWLNECCKLTLNLQGDSKYTIYICKFCIYCHPANSKFTIWHILLLVRIYTYTFKDKIRLRLNTSTYMYIYPPSSLFVRKLLDRVKPSILHTH